jgi:hypothetical protein
MATIRVHRVIAAGPASVALLLAGSTALDLWPGVTRVAGEPGFVSAEVPALVAHAARVRVRARRPRRQPASYVTRFAFTGDGLAATEGELRFRDAGSLATDAVLTLTWSGDGSAVERSRVTAAFRAMAGGFLANLAAVAEARSDAA